MNDKWSNIYWNTHLVTMEDRWECYGHKNCVLWLTGLSASGKSTIANALSKKFHDMDIKNYVLDGDNIRHGLNKDLGFTPSIPFFFLSF